ncbi:MAG: hypothetical protein A2Y00_07730 [Omnitrophica WOR_2 bacterium GWF2_43_52]|nr:MAG: hypothetical protein A2Y00_07730 [Omnitrophica WOR_2 bacterium GWF2_43_52]OGX56566.1 MAG: hypothetical protein A2460_03055 [Omnitrophica WOR_2 bacterium RIFOXYC2_FULL_43_9]HAH22046.1 secretion system protein E [Candidatus Omnitrophota bacterium]HBG62723.1 secretion system protein E [Candidatus Omnitrophota bacterium]
MDTKNQNNYSGDKIKGDTPLSASVSLRLEADSLEELQLKKILSFCEDLDIPVINLANYKIPPELLRLISEDLARTYKIIPVAKYGNMLTVATADPFDIVAIDNFKTITKLDIRLVLSAPAQIAKALNDYYSALNLEKAMDENQVLVEETLKVEAVANDAINIEEIAELSQQVQIVEMVNSILTDGLKQRASDIHIEPYAQKFRIRYRIDGILQERKLAIEKQYEYAVIARLKIMSQLDITQRRLPQDGRISIKVADKEIDLRVSVLPLATGEKIVMRILEKGNVQVNLEKLGFSATAQEAFRRVIHRPNGMILVTGPTGSGKSTTLYAILSLLNVPEKNLITVEDPVEYQMKGITQVHVRSDIGLTFASVLRAILRQTPDVVMVGEIRDFETVDIAIKAALTGHLILSTLHTNDAPSTIVRLINIGVEPFLIASTVNLIAAQRLCRKICQQCKESYTLPPMNLKGLPAEYKDKKAIFFRGKGCPRCNNTGYYGRVAIIEALVMDDVVRQMITDKVPIPNIAEYARKHGMKTLREDAIDKCLLGEISLEEALRVTPEG